MGEVYLAEDKRLRRKVALKLLLAQFINDAERVRRFEREAAAVSAINHPNILTIHEIGQMEQTYYLVTELVAGETLRQRLGLESKANLSLIARRSEVRGGRSSDLMVPFVEPPSP